MNIYREQLWFHNPNIAACFLSMTALLSIGLFLMLIQTHNIYCKIISIFFVFTALAAELSLVNTYSRGGYVGLCMGLLFLFWLTRSKWVLGFAGVFGLFLLIVGNSIARVSTIGQLAEGSIRNRLLLWKGGMALIADNWGSGVGLSVKMGREYTAWFQPLWLDETYDFLCVIYGNVQDNKKFLSLYVFTSYN